MSHDLILNLNPKPLGENVGCCQNTQHLAQQNLHSMHIPDSDNIRKPLPDGDALWTE